MSTNGLSPPGTSTYSSNTLHVGDGTWDSSRDDFLLPNLQGLNFATMRYNGMGNRFAGEPQYHVLIAGHGIMACVTFMVLLPAAAFVARFYKANPRAAMKLHVYLQILVVFCSTVVLALGWFAVGPERSLTNPHHGIGVAIYALVLFQFLYGWWMYRRERRRARPHPTIPLKVYIHKLLGRSIALLSFVQVALGLTLYGSPKYLFVLYTLASFSLLVWYISLSYYYLPVPGAGGPAPSGLGYDDSYVSGPQRSRQGIHWGRDILAAGGLFGAYELWKSRRDQRRARRDDYYARHEDNRPPPPPGPGGPFPPGPPGPPGPGGRPPMRPPSRGSRLSRRPSQSRLSQETWEEDEKYSASPPRHTWRNRVLEAGAGVAAFEGIKSIFGRSRRQQDTQGANAYDSYRPPLGGHHDMVSQADVSRVEAGEAPFSPNDPRRNQRVDMSGGPPMTPTRLGSGRRPGMGPDAGPYDGPDSAHHQRYGPDEGHTLRDSIAAMGAIAGFREWSRRRREQREDQRTYGMRRQDEANEDEYNRRHSGRYPRPEDAHTQRPEDSGTVMTGPDAPLAGTNLNDSRQNFQPDISQPPLPAAAGALPSGPPGPGGAYGARGSRPNVNDQAAYNIPPPPPGPPPSSARPGAGYQPPEPGSMQMPSGAVNPDPNRLVSGHRGQFATDAVEGAAIGGTAAALGAGMAAAHRGQSQSPSRYQSGRDDSRSRAQRPPPDADFVPQAVPGAPEPADSPPVSLKVNMIDGGRHVTLRRLNEEEAAAERASRRRERRQRRTSSLSSGLEDDSVPQQRYRRNNNNNGGGGGGGGIRASSQQPITNVPPPPAMSSSAGGSHRPPSELNLPPPPRMPQAAASSANTLPSQRGQGYARPPMPPPPPALAGSGLGSPSGPQGTDIGNTTDGSAFDTNRRRRRAERARKAEAAKGQKVEFE